MTPQRPEWPNYLGPAPIQRTSPDRVVLTHDDREMCPCCGELPRAYPGGYCKRCERDMGRGPTGKGEQSLMAKVVTTNGINLKGGGEKDAPLTPEQAHKLAALKNEQAEKLGLKVRYEVVD